MTIRTAEVRNAFVAYDIGRARAFRTAWHAGRSYKADPALLAFYRSEMRYSAKSAVNHFKLVSGEPAGIASASL